MFKKKTVGFGLWFLRSKFIANFKIHRASTPPEPAENSSEEKEEETAAGASRTWISWRKLGLAVGLLVLLPVLAALVSFLWPRGAQFSYAGATCISNPLLLPKLVTINANKTFAANTQAGLKAKGYPLFSGRTCVSAQSAPRENETSTITLTALHGVLKQRLRIYTPTAPNAQLGVPATKPIPSKEPLVYTLDQTDNTYGYSMQVGKQTITCQTSDRQISCDLNKLNLAQSHKYTFILQRTFSGLPVETVSETQLATVEAVRVTKTSISQGEFIRSVPAGVTLTLSKPATEISGVSLKPASGKGSDIPITTKTTGGTVTITFTKPLPRDTSYKLVISRIRSADGGYLIKPYSLGFRLSGGPKASSINIAATRVPVNSSVVVYFDSAFAGGQNFARYASISTSRGPIATTVTSSGSTITISPVSALPRCTNFTVRILDGLKNQYGVSGGSAWQYSARTLCQTVFGIGTSVQGRSLTAYSFGSGATKLLFVGNMHGNEKSSKYILDSFVSYLEDNPQVIPASRTVTIIPSVSPDGFAANRRTNAHNVDLNRNFPANNWKTSVVQPGGATLPRGGGTTSLSEPESKALASYTLSQRPRLVLTYHATGGIAEPNNAGDSDALARLYANNSSVYYLPFSKNNTFFDYDTTGAYEDWLHDKYSIPALVIELSGMDGYEFVYHRAAMVDLLSR